MFLVNFAREAREIFLGFCLRKQCFLINFAREARDFFFRGLPLENSVFSRFPLLKTAPQAKKLKPRFQLSGDFEKN